MSSYKQLLETMIAKMDRDDVESFEILLQREIEEAKKELGKELKKTNEFEIEKINELENIIKENEKLIRKMEVIQQIVHNVYHSTERRGIW